MEDGTIYRGLGFGSDSESAGERVFNTALTRRVSDPAAAVERARKHPSLEGRDLVREVTAAAPYEWNEPVWTVEGAAGAGREPPPARHHVVAYDYGIKRGILRRLRSGG